MAKLLILILSTNHKQNIWNAQISLLMRVSLDKIAWVTHGS